MQKISNNMQIERYFGLSAFLEILISLLISDVDNERLLCTEKQTHKLWYFLSEFSREA